MKRTLDEVILSKLTGRWGDECEDKSMGTPIFGVSDMLKDGSISLANVSYRKIDLSKVKNSYVRNGDVLIAKSGNPKVCYYDGEDDVYMSCNFILTLRVNETIIDSKYLFYAIKNLYTNGNVQKYYTSTTIPNLSVPSFMGYQIEVPDITAQRLAVSRLDQLSTIIKLQHKQINYLDDLIKARFVEMFGDPIHNTKNLPTKKVIDVVTLQRGFDLPNQNRNTKGSVPLYSASGQSDWHNESKASNGIITGRSGSIGNVYYCKDKFWPLNTTLFSKDTHGNEIIYLCYLLQFFDLKRFSNGTGVPTLNRNLFHNEQIIDVPLEQQKMFSHLVSQVDKSKFVIQAIIQEIHAMLVCAQASIVH